MCDKFCSQFALFTEKFTQSTKILRNRRLHRLRQIWTLPCIFDIFQMIIGKRKRWRWTFHVLFWPGRIPWNLWERERGPMWIIYPLRYPSCHLRYALIFTQIATEWLLQLRETSCNACKSQMKTTKNNTIKLKLILI